MGEQFSICNQAFFSFTLCNEWISKAPVALIRSNLAEFQGFEFRLQEQIQVTRVMARVGEREYMHVCHGAICSVYTLLRRTPEMSGNQVLRCFCQRRLQAPGLMPTSICNVRIKNVGLMLTHALKRRSLKCKILSNPYDVLSYMNICNIFTFDLRSTVEELNVDLFPLHDFRRLKI